MKRDQIMREIALYKEKLISLKEQLKNCVDNSESEYVGKFFIQNRYESGLRFMYVLDEEIDLISMVAAQSGTTNAKICNSIIESFLIGLLM